MRGKEANEFQAAILLLPKEAIHAFKEGRFYLNSDLRLVQVGWCDEDVDHFIKALNVAFSPYTQGHTLFIDMDSFQAKLKEAIKDERKKPYAAFWYFAFVASLFGGFQVQDWEVGTPDGKKFRFTIAWTREFGEGKELKQIFDQTYEEFRDWFFHLMKRKGDHERRNS